MAAPTAGDLVVIGSSGGMLPFPTSVYADIEGVGSTWATGSGDWQEGRWAFQLIDNATGLVYDSGQMDLSCPNSSVTATAYNRFGASPNAGCVVFDAGEYYWRVKYQNRDGDYSAWATSSTFTVEANTRTKIYVSSGGNDADAGTIGSPKLTLSGAAAIVAGNNVEIILQDDETINIGSAVDLSARTGIVYSRSGDGTNEPKLVLNQSSGVGVTLGADSVINGIEFEYDGATRRNCLTVASSATNVSVLNCNTNEVASFMEIASGASFDGLLIYGGTMRESITRYMVFMAGADRLNILGVDWGQASTTEHSIRIASSVDQSLSTKFVSVDFCDVDHNFGGKSSFRAYPTRFLGAYRCRFARGAVSLANQDARGAGGTGEKFQDYRMDCCVVDLSASPSAVQSFQFYEDLQRCFVASTLIYRDNTQSNGVSFIADRASGGGESVDDLTIAGCTIYSAGTQFGRLFTTDQMTQDSAVTLRGIVFSIDQDDFGAANEMVLLQAGPPSGTSLADCVWWADTVDDQDLLQVGATAYKTAAAINALGFASGNIEENLTINQSTAETSGGTSYQTALSDVTGLFESLNGEVIDRTAESWAAGAWHPVGSGTGNMAGQPGGYTPFIALSAGAHFIMIGA